MQAIIYPSTLSGTILAPASKSSMQRACAAALIAKGKSIINNPGHSNDDNAALAILKAVGCEWSIKNGLLAIDSSKSFLSSSFSALPSPLMINCGESGLGIRMFVPILALCGQEIIVNGEGSLLKRPMDFFDEALPKLGVEVVSNNGKLPLKIKGPLQSKDIEIDGSLSSQFLTGLLFAYSASNTNGVSIKVNNLKSRPYIDLTLKVMHDFGLCVPENRNYKEFYFDQALNAGHQAPVEYTVEGDWSGGAFLLVAGAIAGDIVVEGLDAGSTQADKKIMEALEKAGCDTSIAKNEIKISNPSIALRAFDFEATDCPDLFPPLVALAAYCQGETKIKGAKRLAHKESNRALTLQEEFGKMGVEIVLHGDTMVVKGNGRIKGAIVHSRHDHRIAMACAVAGLKASGATVIEEADAIDKSYPDFYGHLKSLGANLSANKLINQQTV
ncbi:MAG: 3-phosphoshikimate 1-carboxyvinyltransferase [Bacteroidetes bacterium]|nr:3-phosphoshikimate 1-carboxyvinyltransferase [Bacteroidota bacterium]MBS1973323.1 3-phosphoshikimate 1-carboxyvinyltransferase [Bacteroidota bacterium]